MQVELEFGNAGFWGEVKPGVPREKPLGAEKRTNNKLNPRMALDWEWIPGHIGGKRVLSPLGEPCTRLLFFWLPNFASV